MTEELQQQLFEKYPKIFIQKDLDKKQTAMCWGIECRDGWFMLIDTLCHLLQFDIDHNKHPQIEATQVKEKFGGLSFYVINSDDTQDGMISLAESLSYRICESCGSTKDVKLVGKNWKQTLCGYCQIDASI